MKVVIERVYLPQETLSSLYVYGEPIVIGHNGLHNEFGAEISFQCKTLEPPDKGNQHNISCIPEGTYWVHKELTSEGHEYPHFRVENVPDRGGILWHSGNFFKDTLGCLIVGDSFGDRNKDGVLDVLNSRITLQKLYDMLPDRFQATYRKKS